MISQKNQVFFPFLYNFFIKIIIDEIQETMAPVFW